MGVEGVRLGGDSDPELQHELFTSSASCLDGVFLSVVTINSAKLRTGETQVQTKYILLEKNTFY